jgi:hypothetical protein
MSNDTETTISVERYLKIERINRYLATGKATVTYSHTGLGMDFPVTHIDEQGRVSWKREDFTLDIEMGDSQIDGLFAFVVEQEQARGTR